MRSAIDQLENLGESLTKYASAHVVTVAYVLLCAVILFVRFLNDKMKSLETASEQHRRSQRDEGVGTGGEGGIRLITQANEDERDADGVETAVPLPLQPSGDSHTQGIVVETPMLLLPLGDLDEESPPVVEQVEHDGATICSRGNVRKMLKYSIVFLWLYIAGTTLMQMTLASLNAVALVGMWLVTSSLVWRVARLSVNRDDAINFLIEKLSGMCCIGSLMVIWLLVSFMSCMIQEEGTHRNVTRHSRWKNPPSEDVVFKALCDEGDESCLHGLHKREEIICLVALAYVLLGAVIVFVRIMNEKMKSLETASEQDKISQRDERVDTDGEGGSDEDDKPRQRKRDHWATTTTATYQLQGDDRDIESKDEFTPKIALVVETAVPLPLRPSIRGERRT